MLPSFERGVPGADPPPSRPERLLVLSWKGAGTVGPCRNIIQEGPGEETGKLSIEMSRREIGDQDRGVDTLLRYTGEHLPNGK